MYHLPGQKRATKSAEQVAAMSGKASQRRGRRPTSSAVNTAVKAKSSP